MNFLLEQCLVLNGNFSTTIADDYVVKDDGTVATEESEDPAPLLAEKATVIQTQVRGMIARKKMENREQLALGCTRSRAGHTIMKDYNTKVSIEKHIRAIKATLESKKDLWGQCKGALRGEKGTYVSKFARTGFANVHVFTENDTVIFSTKTEKSEKFFDTKPLAAIPVELGGIFEVKYDEDCFVDYDLLLERVQLLHEDVLRPFLFRMKEHLESVMSCLSEIHSWLNESASHLQFLSSTFEKELVIPEDEALKTQIPTIEILKECHVSHDYQITGRFNIEEADEREMVQKMLEFVSN
jgi:hypothetical protein